MTIYPKYRSCEVRSNIYTTFETFSVCLTCSKWREVHDISEQEAGLQLRLRSG